jgi:hypothetical protein
MKPETRLTNRIRGALKDHGGWWVKIHGSAFQTAGVPDLVGCYRGRFVGLEVKLPDDRSKLSKVQGVMLLRIRNAGGVAKVVRSTEAALQVVREIDRELDNDG